MKHIIIHRGLAVAVLLMVASVARAEIAGIRDVSECPTLIQNKTALFNALSNLSPASQQASAYFQADKGRFVFCIDPDPTLKDWVTIQAPTTLTNTSQYPVIIYNLTVDSSSATVGKPLLTTTGPFLFQNLTAKNLRGPIVMGGAASMMASTLSCDTTPAGFYSDKVLMITGIGQRFTKVSISNCNEAIEVIGTGSVLKDLTVTFDKALSPYDMEGGEGVILGAGSVLTATALGATTISGYASALEMMSSSRATYVKVIGAVSMKESAKLGLSDVSGTVFVTGNAVLVSKNTLAGEPAVQIAKGMTGVKVTENTFTKASTIAYMDPDEAKANTLLSVEWMGKKVDKTDPNIVTFVGGKLLDSANMTESVETIHKGYREVLGQYVPFAQCKVAVATEKISVHFKDAGGNDVEKDILPNDKYFGCAFDPSAPDKVSTTDYLRFISNTPTVSLMSENIVLKDFGDWPTVLINPASVIAPDGGALGGDSSPSVQNDMGGGDVGGNDAKVPDTTPEVYEAAVESGGGSGNAMTPGGSGLASTPSAAGASMGCGGQMMPGIPAAPGVMFWWLAPVVVLWYGRKTRR